MKTRFTTLLIAIFLVSICTADAQVVRSGVGQHRRIKDGVRSGELTKAEALNLRKGKKDIRQDVREAKADGVVTGAEKRDIKQNQRKQGHKIARKKHNNTDHN